MKSQKDKNQSSLKEKPMREGEGRNDYRDEDEVLARTLERLVKEQESSQTKSHKDIYKSLSKELLAQLKEVPCSEKLTMKILDKLKEEHGGVAMSTQLEQSLYSDMVLIRTLERINKQHPYSPKK
jgi:signal recognition particle GTPase